MKLLPPNRLDWVFSLFRYFLQDLWGPCTLLKRFMKSLLRNLGHNRARFSENISEEIRDLTANDIGQNLGTFGRHMEHWADIGLTEGRHWADIGKTLGRHWADIGQTLGRHWADIWHTLGRHWEDIGKTLGRHWADIGQILDRHCSPPYILRLFVFLMQYKTHQ